MARPSQVAIRVLCLVVVLIPLLAGRSVAPVNGFAFMDVTSRSAVFWTRADTEGKVTVELTDPAGKTRSVNIPIDRRRGLVASQRIRGLAPGTLYSVVAYLPTDGGTGWTLRGELRTAPDADAPVSARMAFGGDVGGQNVCRDAERGYPIFGVISKRKPDLFVGLGDMIYADGACRAEGLYGNTQLPGETEPATTLLEMRARWIYNRNDPGWIDLMARTPYVPVWDDHEIVDDFGPSHDSPPGKPDTHLFRVGRRAFLESNPVAVGRNTRLHRRLRWGRHLELFVLDTRQQRDSNSVDDRFTTPKTMLGRDQLDWLLASLTISDATWNVVVSSVPISIPTGAVADPSRGRDGWASGDGTTGFENELRKLLINLYEAGIRNLVWITTDIHFASVQRYQPFARYPDFIFHEMATGPLQAGVFPNELLDDSFHPERLFRWPPLTVDSEEFEIASFEEALHWFNFGELEVDTEGTLTMRVINGEGVTLYEHTLTPVPRGGPAKRRERSFE